MSYDIRIVDKRQNTYVFEDGSESTISIPYTYYEKFSSLFDDEPPVQTRLDMMLGGPLHSGIRSLYSLKGKDTIKILEEAISKLGDERDRRSPYMPTDGNVKNSLKHLLYLAKRFPNGHWEGD